MSNHSLRDRIAAVLKAQAEFRGIYKIADFDFAFLADAVIAGLPELSYGAGHLHCGTHDDDNRCPCPCCGNRPTDWKADDE